MIKHQDVIDTLERFAPLPLQESYDNAGLQCGLTEAETSGVLLCLDVTEAIVEEAERKGCNLIVAHHPLLFHPLRCVSNNSQAGRCVAQAIHAGITIYAAHTNLDNAPHGVNYKMAEQLGLQGPYTFLEPKAGITGGSGLLGRLAEPTGAWNFLLHVRYQFDTACLLHNEPLERPVQRVALCGGAGDYLLDRAIAAGADAFVTGEMHYHMYFGHEQQIQIVVAGHYETEQFTIQLLRDIIRADHADLCVELTEVRTNPIYYLL